MTLILVGRAGACFSQAYLGSILAAVSDLEEVQMGFDDSDASLPLWVIFVSSATIGDRRRDGLLQWV